MNTDFLNHLKTLADIDIDTHSGSYELVRQGVARLAKVTPENIDVSDLEMLFHFGNLRHGRQVREKNIASSNLHENDKQYLINLNKKIATGTYTNSGLDDSHQANGNCGLFAKGRQTLIGLSNKEAAQSFIRLLISISEIPEERANDIYQMVADCLSRRMEGIGVGIASQILHLLKPTLFPILNKVGQKGYKNKIGLPLIGEDDIGNYIENVKIINNFKKIELPSLNFRTIDVALWNNRDTDSSEFDVIEDEDDNNGSAILPTNLILDYLGGLKETHKLLKRAKLFELNNSNKVLVRASKLLPAGRYFYGLQKSIIDGNESIDFLVLVKGNEGFYKIPYDMMKKLCLDGAISFADKGKSANEAVMGYRINIEFNKESKKYELKLIGNRPAIDIDEFYHKIKSDISRNSDIRYWIYTPGEKARLWNDFYSESIMGIGWDEIGDLSEYHSKSDIKTALQKLFSDDKSHKNDTHALWEFANKISVGDVVFVKKGYSLVLGRGIVESDYTFDNEREEYKHIRKVNWTHFGEWAHPGQAVQKTLTDITSFTDYVEELEALFRDDSNLFENDDKPEINYDKYTAEDFLRDVYITPNRYKTLKNLLLRKKNIILQGAPGVGKTFAAKLLAFSIMEKKDTSRVKIVQFHQSYSYEDFIMGWRPDGSGFKLEEGPFYKFCKLAEVDDENEPYFFIIDEINRGNLSKIFGELLMLIESDKRGDSIRLLYKDEQFSVPKNVHIIGMMNTADRSLAMIDYALRRRFAFFDMAPAFQADGFKEYQSGINNPKFDNLIATVERLNSEISKDTSLGDGFRIGHSYFCVGKDIIIDDDWISDVVEYELIPLLSEYWFDEPKKSNEWSSQLRNAINGR